MGNPRFSILIPTRDRPATLRHTLATAISQPGDDYEVVVADNCGSPATKLVVDEAASRGRRIVYLRSDEPLTMGENWERGLSACSGDYVTVLGSPGDVRAGPERDRVTVEDVIGGVAGVAALVRMSTAWRVGDLIRGGVLTWAVGSDGSLWLAELDATGGSPLWELRSTDVEGLCATLLDHLPGA